MNERLKELAVQAGMQNTLGCFWQCSDDAIERFAELVRQDERRERGAVLRKQDEQIKEMQFIHARLREKFNKVVLEEREAIAALVEADGQVHPKAPDAVWAKTVAKLIRARGNHEQD